MRRVWIALAALIAFVASFAGTLIIGISQSVESDCDGVCFSELPAIGLAAYAVGVVSAIVAALAAWRHLVKRSSVVKPPFE